jgi:DEAD/DEAH box helicase domain-containing protein
MRSGSDLRAFTYDGDTPQDARRAIRERANVVLTNPDMLHAGILPHHTKWAKAFENLRYVVIDELHYYRGVYGSHLANVLRRLKRICEFYGSSPQFHLFVGNDRESERAGRSADRVAVRAGLGERRARGRQVRRCSTIRRW